MFTELYREEKREEGDRGGQEDKKGGIKRRETDSASNQFLKCFSTGEKGERAVKPVISLPSKNGY